MIREEHILGNTASYRFPGENADHALLVLHGLGGHGGIYDNFAGHHAAQGVDVWCMDAPGHGRSTITGPQGRFTIEEWVEAAVAYGEHIATTTGLPVFVKGSSPRGVRVPERGHTAAPVGSREAAHAPGPGFDAAARHGGHDR
ncbi:lysophospholipase [Rhodococcus sp. DMU2021]|uniref:alpha/beta fold hydrolase n=1 Tax=Rhodococcus sp. DMU2021 TaxID=2866997 RepID=UPI001C7DC099|nr:lysophospholipase [Rhodococcus sp. DMU2021]